MATSSMPSPASSRAVRPASSIAGVRVKDSAVRHVRVLVGSAPGVEEHPPIAQGPRAPAARSTEQTSSRAAGEPAFAAWSNRPGDPWQASLPPGAIPSLVASSRLVAAFGPAGVLDPGVAPTRRVALGLVDTFSETIPSSEHTTSVAFHFDAPGARAPQAILVAVPPAVDVPLDTATLVAIVAETRDAAHARMATPEEIDALAAALPLTMLPANSPAGVTLLPD